MKFWRAVLIVYCVALVAVSVVMVVTVKTDYNESVLRETRMKREREAVILKQYELAFPHSERNQQQCIEDK